MKRFLTILALLSIGLTSSAQEKLYLMLDYMKVSNDQLTNYMEAETWWSRIHQESANAGEIEGWDLWSLKPGGQDQGYQYVTVILFNDPAKMMGWGSMDDIMRNAKKAYPDLSNEQLMEKFTSTVGTRTLSAQVYYEVIDQTAPQYEMKVGMVTSIDLMKTTPANFGAYEKAEKTIFKPDHQKMVDAGAKGSWSLARVLSPVGTETYSTHVTFNFYNDWDQYFQSFSYDFGEVTIDDYRTYQEGLATREMKWVYLGQLEMMVRP